eukprot:m.38098 g.38098  ORF g.38098 m.38098 type:complete len:138 (+) comp17829_c0_seq1:677-1090(+)
MSLYKQFCMVTVTGVHLRSLWLSNSSESVKFDTSLSMHLTKRLLASPAKGTIVDSYRSMDISCAKCRYKLFVYKKKNGTKSRLVRMYKERITVDLHDLLDADVADYTCPSCNTQFGRSAVVRGRDAIKIVGNRIQMK